MNELLKELAGIAVAAVLATDGFLHAYWATGQIWPARDQLTLIQAVLNSNKTRLLRPTVLAPLAGLLLLGALIVLARVHLFGMLGQLIPGPLLAPSGHPGCCRWVVAARCGWCWMGTGPGSKQEQAFLHAQLSGVYTCVFCTLHSRSVRSTFLTLKGETCRSCKA
jgi:hypothetical protein